VEQAMPLFFADGKSFMSTFWILLGFGLMLFVPCFVTMLGSREDKDDSVYSDRFIDETERARAAEAMQAKAAEAGGG
jgi:hypothetical protein